MNKCSSCGLGNFAGTSVCRRCGTALDVASEAQREIAASPLPAPLADVPLGRPSRRLTPFWMIGGIGILVIVLMVPAMIRKLSAGPPPATPIARQAAGDERWMANIGAYVNVAPEWNVVGASQFNVASGIDQQFAFWAGGQRAHPERAIAIHTGAILGPQQTVSDFIAMSDDELVETVRDYTVTSKGYAWKATAPCAVVPRATGRAAYCRGEYTTPGQVYNGCQFTVVLTKRIVTMTYFTTRDDADVWSEAQAVAASLRD